LLAPTLLPNTVTEAAPVLALFDATTLETDARSNDIPRVMQLVSATSAVVASVATVGRPALILHRTADADVHTLASLPLPPTRFCALDAHGPPTPAPSSVTLAAPVRPPLPPVRPDNMAMSSVSTDVTLPA
jgi:hypothetical protein